MQKQQEALTRAVSNESFANYATIIKGFSDKGIALDDIKPRENVFTFEAWKALGRYVRKGEKGVQILTFIDRKDKDTGVISRRPWRTTVFHISQTESIN
jgi:hypothetical protein